MLIKLAFDAYHFLMPMLSEVLAPLLGLGVTGGRNEAEMPRLLLQMRDSFRQNPETLNPKPSKSRHQFQHARSCTARRQPVKPKSKPTARPSVELKAL